MRFARPSRENNIIENRRDIHIARTKIAAVFCVALLAASSPGLCAGEGKPVETETRLDCTVTTEAELKVKLIEEIRVPFLAGEGMLTRDNNAKIKLAAELSPVSINGTFETVVTPIGFLELVAGAAAGSGWNIPIADGLRINARSGAHDAELTGNAFAGIVWSVKGGAALQGDLAAFVPGDWNHLVFRTYHAFQYRALTSAEAGESWLYEADGGENMNGWNYYGNYFLGYQMPIKLKIVGLLVEEEMRLYGSAGEEAWGDDLSRWTFGLMGTYAFTDRVSGTLLAQCRTMRNFSGDTGDYEFYQDRIVDESDERHIEFYRLVANVSFRLK